VKLVAVAALVAAGGCGGEPRVDVVRDGEVVLSVDVRIATREADRERGLRGEPALGDGDGLLIELPRQLAICLVNDGVDQSIDALFADGGGRIVAIERGIPADDPTERCYDARWILEVAAGVGAPAAVGDDLVVTP
jgi:uncharacterized membrane protein (UPF0127 family)